MVGLGAAVVLGVLAVAGVRYSGWLNKPPPPPPVKGEPVMVLAAKKNLYKGTQSTANDVGLRPASKEESDRLRDHPEDVMPPNIEAAHLRTVKRNVQANSMLMQDDFLPIDLPNGVEARLADGMRAVVVELPKERAGDGLLRVGEYVDVLLTSKVCTDPSGSQPRTATAIVASALKIVVKRGYIFDNLAIPVDPEKPISYMLEANPYRAALIELCKSRGLITVVSSDQTTARDVHAVRAFLAHNPQAAAEEVIKSLAEKTIKIKQSLVDEEKREQQLVAGFDNRESSVSEKDLEEIFRLPPITPAPQPLRVLNYDGSGKLSNVTVINQQTSDGGSGGYSFFIPGDNQQARPGGNNTGPRNNISVQSGQPNKK
jgi:Flp pilus assembly protein CpaB